VKTLQVVMSRFGAEFEFVDLRPNMNCSVKVLGGAVTTQSIPSKPA
jgi:hypothetical protein